MPSDSGLGFLLLWEAVTLKNLMEMMEPSEISDVIIIEVPKVARGSLPPRLGNLLWNVTGNRNSGCKGIRDTLGREETLLIGHVAAKRRKVTV